jgi:DNA-binding transcriptional LysR family regulator
MAEGNFEYGIRDWNDLRVILAIARCGHFLGAAKALNTNQTTVSRKYQRIEGSLGTKLFERHGNQLRITPVGEALIERATAMENLIAEINLRMGALDVLPYGTVKLAVTEGIAQLWLAPKLVRFTTEYPDINLEIIPTRGGFDLLSNGADIAIGMQRPQSLRCVGAIIGSVQFSVFAAPAYIERNGTLNSLEDVGNHEFVLYETHHELGFGSTLMAEAERLHRIRLRTGSASVCLAAIHSGVGAGVMPSFYKNVPSALVEQPLTVAEQGNLWLASHEETNRSRRVRIFLDFVRSCFEEDKSVWFRRQSGAV